jgi:ATP-dependent DNA helicase RecG
MNQEEFERLVAYLIEQKECEWVEFKENFSDVDSIGEYISALANSASISSESHGYLLWGVADSNGELVGTTFDPKEARKGNQPLHIGIAASLDPRVHFEFIESEMDQHRVVVLCVDAAHGHPVKYKGKSYVRVGESKTSLQTHPDKEKMLWETLQTDKFEDREALSGLDQDQVISLLDYPKYFDSLGMPLPDNKTGIIDSLVADGIVASKPIGLAISVFGAVLFAKNLTQFPSLSRKGVRIVSYSGDNRVNIKKQQSVDHGYAVGFEGLITYIGSLLPEQVEIGPALRVSIPTFPEVAIRELVANALIHQDIAISGTGPLIEIFNNRIEITNPGHPLVPPDRFADMPPRSRNERIASFMRRIGICEELGSGIDRVLSLVEASQLPAPEFVEYEDNCRVILFSAKPFGSMSKDERIRACYWHAVYLRIGRQQMTNSSLRNRFNIKEKNQSQVSRVISDTLEANLIRRDPPDDKSKRHAKYVPIWA